MNLFSQNFSAPFRGQFHEEYDAFQRLYAHQLIECRTGGHVVDQMRRLVEDHVTEPLSSVADAVHRWLSDRYDTKLWHVVVWNGARRRFSFDSQFYVTSSASQVNAAALSVDAEHLAAVDLKLSRTAQHAAVVFNLMLRLHADKPRDAGVHHSRLLVSRYFRRAAIYVDSGNQHVRRGFLPYHNVSTGKMSLTILPSAAYVNEQLNRTTDDVHDTSAAGWRLPVHVKALLNDHGLCLSVKDDHAAGWQWLNQRPFSRQLGQLWTWADGRITNRHGLCLTSGSVYAYQAPCPSTGHQLVTWRRQGYSVVDSSGRCLTASGSDEWISLTDCNNASGQQWYFTKDGATREDF